MKKFVTVFRRIGGRIVPIRKAVKAGEPDEIQKVVHVRRARKYLKEDSPDKLGTAFWRTARKESKIAGDKIGRRIAKLKGRKK